MKILNSIEILKTERTLNADELKKFRLKFKSLLKFKGIISLCLEENELYIEYNATLFNSETFKNLLLEQGFPLELQYH